MKIRLPSLKSKKWFIPLSALLIFVITLLILWGLTAWSNAQILSSLSDQKKLSKDEYAKEESLSAVSSLLPITENGETVLVGTITDVETLSKQQEFFKKAKNGDKVYIYKDKTVIVDGKGGNIIDIARVRLLK